MSFMHYKILLLKPSKKNPEQSYNLFRALPNSAFYKSYFTILPVSPDVQHRIFSTHPWLPLPKCETNPLNS